MSEQQNEILAHRFHMDIFQKGDLAAADNILAKDFIWRNPIVPPELTRGPEGAKKVASAVIDSMPDLQITHEDTLTKGDKVLIRWKIIGTPKKQLFGISPSNNPVTLIGFDLFRISGGKIVEMWQQLTVA
jgi:predicted SnoaL-like aldol condensation-catalyzing enzyme